MGVSIDGLLTKSQVGGWSGLFSISSDSTAFGESPELLNGVLRANSIGLPVLALSKLTDSSGRGDGDEERGGEGSQLEHGGVGGMGC